MQKPKPRRTTSQLIAALDMLLDPLSIEAANELKRIAEINARHVRMNEGLHRLVWAMLIENGPFEFTGYAQATLPKAPGIAVGKKDDGSITYHPIGEDGKVIGIDLACADNMGGEVN